MEVRISYKSELFPKFDPKQKGKQNKKRTFVKFLQ